MKKILLSLMIITATLKVQAVESCKDETEAAVKAKIIAFLIPSAQNSTHCKVSISQSWERSRFESDRHDINNYATVTLQFMDTIVWRSDSFFVGGSYGTNPLPGDTVRAGAIQTLVNSEKSSIRKDFIQQLKTFGCL